MQDEQYGKVEKIRVKTRITTVDGVDQSGEIFLSPNQRIIDMMNDGRAFIAFEAEDGFAVLIVTPAEFDALRRPGAYRLSGIYRSASSGSHLNMKAWTGRLVSDPQPLTILPQKK